MNTVRMLAAAFVATGLAACGQPSGGGDAMDDADMDMAEPASVEAETMAPAAVQPAMELMPTDEAGAADSGDAGDAMAEPADEPAMGDAMAEPADEPAMGDAMTEPADEPAMDAAPAMEAEPATTG